MKKNLASVFVVAAMWLMGSLSAFGYNGTAWYQDPCYTNWSSSNCVSSATIEIKNIIFTPITAAVCLGNSLQADASTTNHDGQVQKFSYNLAETTDCPNTNWIEPTAAIPTTNWWVVSGPGGYNASGSGLSTGSFTPTNIGTGKVIFYQKYTNASPCTGSGTATRQQNFTVKCPTPIPFPGDTYCGGPIYNPITGQNVNGYGASFNIATDCDSSGIYFQEVVTQNTNSCSSILNSYNPAPTPVGGINDPIAIFGNPQDVAPCEASFTQIIKLGPLDSSGTNVVATCIITNIQTISVQINPASPGHGTVTTTSLGLSQTCNW